MPKSLKAFVLTADQVKSRSGHDRVPDALAALADVVDDSPTSRSFARTAGDEIQGLTASAEEITRAVEILSRLGGWRIGIGVGEVETPLPDQVQAATGTAFYAARQAVEASRRTAQGLVLCGHSEATPAQDADAALTLLRAVWSRRSEGGWQVAQLVADGLTTGDIAARLGVSASAVSQRVKTAAVEETDAGKRLATHCLERALNRPE